MNKFILFPLAIVVMVTLMVMANTGFEPPSTTTDDFGGGDSDFQTTPEDTITVSFPLIGSFEMSIFALLGFNAIVLGAVALLGIRGLGSGLSDTTQTIVMTALIYGTLFTGFAGVTYGILDDWGIMGTLIFVTLTLVYMIGIVTEVQGKTSGMV